MANDIHPVFDRMLTREQREARLQQRARVLWFTGLSGSGKSTVAIGVEQALFAAGYFPQLLDGDNIRSGINANLGFSIEDRRENIRRIAEVANLYKESGLIVLCAFISPTREMRELARSIIGPEDFLEIYVNTPLEICERRDVKGLYAKARSGQIKGFTGIDSPYEIPERPFLDLNTKNQEIKDSILAVMKAVSGSIETTTI
jgi:adenylylsulfate kinase